MCLKNNRTKNDIELSDTINNINNNDTLKQYRHSVFDLRTRLLSGSYLRLAIGFIKWFIISVAVGIAVGLIGTLFNYALEAAGKLREANSYTIFLLPVAGLVITFLYKKSGAKDDKGTNTIILAARKDQRVYFRVMPIIFISTFLTHLFGGSAGREGAALQIGGSTVAPFGKWLKLDKKDTSVLIMCGMSAGFSALFGTPVAAAVFAIEVTIVGVAQYSAIVPCLIASCVSALTAKIFGVHAESFDVTGVPAFDSEAALPLIRVIALGICCALISMLFCVSVHEIKHSLKKYITNSYIRIAVGGTIICILTLLVGSRDYNGAGMNIINDAIAGHARPEAFLLKLFFTAVTLGAGYKGGEIVPSLFVGATFGCTVGPLFGLDPSFAASMCMTAVFCGVTNCPLASIILTAELFGLDGFAFYAVAIGVSYMLSGYWGLYSVQKFYHSKLKPIRYDK